MTFRIDFFHGDLYGPCMQAHGRQLRNPRWIDASILIGSAFFVFALFLSAVFDPTIRTLHALQALIYVAVVVLTRRQSAFGFGAGLFIAAFWNYTNLFVTTFIKAGLAQIPVWIQTGRLARPDLLVAVVAAGGHFLIMTACAVAFSRLHPAPRQYAGFVVGGVLAVAYLVLIIYTTGPQYISLVRAVFHF